jgi:hypothetical protein
MIFEDNYNFYFDLMLAINYLSESYSFYTTTFFSDYFDFLSAFIPLIQAYTPHIKTYTGIPNMYIENLTIFYAVPYNSYQIVDFNENDSEGLQFFFDIETVATVCITFAETSMFLFFIFVIFALYMSAFSTQDQNFKTLDQEFLTIQSSVTAEEELGSFDDKIFFFIFFFFIVGWFFLNNFFTLFSGMPYLTIYFWVSPMLIGLLICIPINFFWNFGVAFTSYLRGVSVSNSNLNELLFDLIAVAATFIKFLIQSIRLLLITFVYITLHDLWFDNAWLFTILYANESFLQDLLNIEFSLNSVSFFIFLKIPFWIFYILFEITHIFFVLTAQFFAFIVMIFWLFFFMYTCFTTHPVENYINTYRNI